MDNQDEQRSIIDGNGSYVNIDPEGMHVWLYLEPPKEGNYSKDDIMEFLHRNKVTTGFHTSNIAAIVKKKIYNREILVAKGQPAIEGSDGYFEYRFDPEQYKSPKVLPNGNVDYASMGSLQNVHQGDVVAVYHHATKGQDGYNVSGERLGVKPVKDIQAIRGQVTFDQDNPDVYLAAKDGKIELKSGRIDIQGVHEIFDDVTLISPKIEFYGDIVIHGNVEAGVVIRAGRNVEINGIVEAVNIFSGGDIILSRGIQGAQRAKLSARGNILADFIEHTVATAGGNVQANTIMNSRISADGEVILTGKKGALIGGYTHGFQGITATEIGNQVEVRTVVHAGCEKEVFYRNMDVRKKENMLKEHMASLYGELESLAQKKKLNDGVLMQSLLFYLKKLEDDIYITKNELQEIVKERQTLEQLMEKGKNVSVTVGGNIYRGTVVSIGQMQMPIENSTCFMKYVDKRGLIEGNVIAYS